MKGNKGVIIVFLLTILMGVGLGGLSFASYSRGNKEFAADGFILVPSEQINVTNEVNQQHYFSAGDKYREKFGTNIIFKDVNGDEVNLPNNQFVHYNDGSLGAFTNGVIMDISDMENSKYGYYNVSKNTILLKNGGSYDITSHGSEMHLNEFVWKISDTDYMFVSPEIQLLFSEDHSVTLENYAQIKYVDNGIVRIVHQSGTYQTISQDTSLISESGAELNLVGKAFMVNGEESFSLERMTLNDDSYIDIDENIEQPEIKIPTFQVINGQNGKNGESGAQGEQGASGEDGAEGEIGETGEDGGAGGGGGAGAAGAFGEDGMQGGTGEDGDAGQKGRDGLNGDEGAPGMSASNAASVTGQLGYDAYMRPIISVTPSSVDVEAGKIAMEMKMMDTDAALDTTTPMTMKLYDRATMKEVADFTAQANALASGTTVNFSQSGLTPDTEYVLIVSGKYKPSTDATEYLQTDFYTQIIKTPGLGFKLEKLRVEEDRIFARTVGDNSAGYTYDVALLENKDDLVKGISPICSYTGQTGLQAILEFNAAATKPSNFTSGVITSNTTYYLAICNVMDENAAVVNCNLEPIEVKTLKKPIVTDDVSALRVEQTTAKLITNVKNKSFTLSADNMKDVDNGIVKIHYQLFQSRKYNDAINAANPEDGINNLIPDAEEIAYGQKLCTFSLSDEMLYSDASKTVPIPYVGRVVFEFDDNEKIVMDTTQISTPVSASTGEFPMVVFTGADGKILTETAEGDRINCTITITDTSDMFAVSADHPLRLTVSNEYSDVFFKEYTQATQSVAHTYEFDFSKDGLRKNTAYTLSVSGAVKTPGESEYRELTYIGGIRTTTVDYQPLVAVYNLVPTSGSAFGVLFNISSGNIASGSDLGALVTSDEIAKAKYSASVLDSVKLELYQMVGEAEKKIGEHTITDKSHTTENHQSMFEYAWADQNLVRLVNGSRTAYESLTPNYGEAGYESEILLTPASFGLNDAMFSGGTYRIRAISANDYTSFKNEIDFFAGKNQIEFKIDNRHLQGDATDIVDVMKVYNENGNGKRFAELDDDTVVGWNIQAQYANTDVTQVVYSIYEISDTEPDYDNNGGKKNILYPEGTVGLTGKETLDAVISDGNKWTKIGTVVVDGLDGAVNAGRVPVTTLYFDRPEDAFSGSGMTSFYYEPGKTIQRGKRYFVSYSLTASCQIQDGVVTGIDCDGNGLDDLYPNCVYPANKVPLYRSKVLKLEKQAPEIVRYPYSSSTSANTATWMYQIDDPDNALLLRNGGYQYKLQPLKYDATNGYVNNGSAVTANTDPVAGFSANTWHAVTYPKLSSATEYNITFEYKTLSSQEETRKITTGTTHFTRAANVSVSDKIKVVEIMNQGSYLYRLKLAGDDLLHYVGFRIEVVDSSNSANKVVYDPIYPDVSASKSIVNMGGSDVETYTATLDLDTAGFRQLRTSNPSINMASLKLYGYYSTGNSGYDDSFTPINDEVLQLEGVSKYAILGTSRSDGESGYYRLNPVSGAFEKVVGNMSGSLLAADAADGFDLANRVFHMRYIHTPMLLTGNKDTYSKNLNDVAFGINETGVFSDAFIDDTYISLERIGTKEFADSVFAVSREISAKDIMPSIKMDTTKSSSGAFSVDYRFDIFGVGATSDAKIYAELYEVLPDSSTQLIAIAHPDDGSGGKDMTRFAVTGGVPAYDKTSFEDQYLPIEAVSGGKFAANARIQGLERNATYRIKVFSYASDNTKVYLYDTAYKQAERDYELTTKSFVQINVAALGTAYNSFNNRRMRASFAMSGDDGTGVTVKYRLKDEVNNTYPEGADWKVLPPRGSGALAYYSADPTVNNNFEFVIGYPGALLIANKTYALEVDVVPSGGEEVSMLETHPYIYHFTTPSTLKRPSFYVSASTTKTASKFNVKVNYSCRDEQCAVAGSDLANYTKNAFKFELLEEDENGDAFPAAISNNVLYADYSGSNSSAGHVVFENVTDGKTYIVRATALYYLDGSSNTEQLKQERTITISNTPTADIGLSATAIPNGGESAVLSIALRNKANFTNVSKMVITVYATDGTMLASDTRDDITPEGNQEFDWNWRNIRTPGWYNVQIQYQNASGKMLGNDNSVVKVN